MKTKSKFVVNVNYDDCINFAEVSGDWNRLHTDKKYALGTNYKKPVLHGAFLSGLISRMAGMEIPGKTCILHSINLNFLKPIIPPRKIIVEGSLIELNRVEVAFKDFESGILYAKGQYNFSEHDKKKIIKDRKKKIHLAK